MSDDIDTAPYSIPDEATHPAIMAERVMQMPEHRHLKDNEVSLGWLMRNGAKVKGGRVILGTVYRPQVQGELRDLFAWMLDSLLGFEPQFLVVLDAAYWSQATPRQREILVFHELSHIKQAENEFGAPKFTKTGEPIYTLRGHDVEEFTDVVARYGQWNDDIRAFVAAANQHD